MASFLKYCAETILNVIFYDYKSFHLEQRAARTAYISKNLQYSEEKKCVRLLRPWRDTKHFSMSKAVFTNMSVGEDLSACTL